MRQKQRSRSLVLALPVNKFHWSVVPVAASGNGGAVDKAINPAKSLFGLGNDVLGLVRVGEVGLERERVTTRSPHSLDKGRGEDKPP